MIGAIVIVLMIIGLLYLVLSPIFKIDNGSKETYSEYNKPEEIKHIDETPESIKSRKEERLTKIGKGFEGYVQNEIFNGSNFKLVYRTIDKDENGDLQSQCRYPDFKFRDMESDTTFWLECKYRNSRVDHGKIVWCEDYQLKRYKGIRASTNTKIYVIVGLGGSSEHPQHLFFFDLDDVYYTELFYNNSLKLEISNRKYNSLKEIIGEI